MYKYTFILGNGKQDQFTGDRFKDVLENYLQWRGTDILTGVLIDSIEIRGAKGEPYTVKQKLIDQIISTLKEQNPALMPPSSEPALPTQQEKCAEMKELCPPDSKEADPLTLDDWCDDVPYQEFVQQDEYLSQCYRLSNLINSFTSGLEATKNEQPFPQWPRDPFHNTAISQERLQELYDQAKDAKLEIPTIFTKFVQGLNAGLFDVKAAMADPYKGTHINQEHVRGFIEPVVELLFSKAAVLAQTQEEKDLEMALQLAEELSH